MATGTTPSVHGNHHHLDAIIPRQILSGRKRLRVVTLPTKLPDKALQAGENFVQVLVEMRQLELF